MPFLLCGERRGQGRGWLVITHQKHRPLNASANQLRLCLPSAGDCCCCPRYVLRTGAEQKQLKKSSRELKQIVKERNQLHDEFIESTVIVEHRTGASNGAQNGKA